MARRLKFIFFILFAFTWFYFFQSACQVLTLNFSSDLKKATVSKRASDDRSSITWWGMDGKRYLAPVRYAREKLSHKRLLGFIACEWNGRHYLPSYLKGAYAAGEIPVWYTPRTPENYCVGDAPPPLFGLATLSITLLPIPLLIFLRSFALDCGLLPSPEELENAASPTQAVARRIRTALSDRMKGGRYDSLYCMSMLMALSDGKLCDSETHAINTIVERLTKGATATTQLEALRVLRQARSSGISFARYAEMYARRVSGNRSDLELGLELLVTVALSDHSLQAEQERLLNDACRIFGLRETRVAQAISRITDQKSREEESRLRGTQSKGPRQKSHQSDTKEHTATQEGTSAWALKELDCPEGTSLDGVKKQYRTLVKQYHPDKLRSRGVTGQLLQQGEQRFLRIQKAYEVLAGG